MLWNCANAELTRRCRPASSAGYRKLREAVARPCAAELAQHGVEGGFRCLDDDMR